MYYFKLILIFQFAAINLFAQNLISNGGFELYEKCPDHLGQIARANGWKNQNEGTCDYFNSCLTKGIYISPGKSVTAHTGNGWAGFCSIKQQAFELMQTRLTAPLDTAKIYCLELYLYKSKEFVPTENELAVLFSKAETKSLNGYFYDERVITNNKLVTHKIPSTARDGWIPVCIKYQPKYPEQYMTIGLNKATKVNELEIEQPYYYIDDISLVEWNEGEKCSCEPDNPIATATAGKPLILQHINFEVNKATLLASSYTELEQLSVYFKEHVNYKIELSGHTDNTGKEADNIKLSALRAKAVADYLVQQGIAQSRVSYKGYGSSKSLTDNSTEANRLKNRRVEVIFK